MYVDETIYECKTQGQELSVVSRRKLYTYTGVIICPSYKEVCVVGVPPTLLSLTTATLSLQTTLVLSLELIAALLSQITCAYFEKAMPAIMLIDHTIYK